MPNTKRTYEILAVEDNEPDAKLIEYAWRECRIVETNIRTLLRSMDIVTYLRGGKEYSGGRHPLPDLILLDYHMPLNGGSTLARLKNDPEFRIIPVAVITGSKSPQAVLDVYQRLANCCLLKPVDLQGFLDMVCFLAEFWLKRVLLPPKPRQASAEPA
jgi:two-component system, chemotaxis family, response regulator Rcp1